MRGNARLARKVINSEMIESSRSGWSQSGVTSGLLRALEATDARYAELDASSCVTTDDVDNNNGENEQRRRRLGFVPAQDCDLSPFGAPYDCGEAFIKTGIVRAVRMATACA